MAQQFVYLPGDETPTRSAMMIVEAADVRNRQLQDRIA